ncbi:hypothetical protein N399_12895 [Bacillus licheniformis CG-B52]|nr:hypothetical protein N399_12895 [Bacillus licheniformis CG-B52]KUL10906.1 hypothetical protein LI17339_13125 [Bacillus licheniformis LMG 17339]
MKNESKLLRQASETRSRRASEERNKNAFNVLIIDDIYNIK